MRKFHETSSRTRKVGTNPRRRIKIFLDGRTGSLVTRAELLLGIFRKRKNGGAWLLPLKKRQMAERTPKQLCRILREQSRNVNWEELSEDEPDRGEKFDEVEDIQDVDEDTSLDDSRRGNLKDSENDSSYENVQPGPRRSRSIVKGKSNYK